LGLLQIKLVKKLSTKIRFRVFRGDHIHTADDSNYQLLIL